MYLQSRYYDGAIGRFLNADSYAATGQGYVGNNMFAYCNNNPVMYIDPAGAWPALGLEIAIACLVVKVATFAIAKYVNHIVQTKNAENKYNASTVSAYEENNSPEEKNIVNVKIYYPWEGASNISVDASLSITSKYEQNAVLDVIMESPFYSEKVYGSKKFMRAQWVAHNLSYSIASSGPIGFRVMQILSGSLDPIESSASLDIRSKNNILKRQKFLYTLLSWVC